MPTTPNAVSAEAPAILGSIFTDAQIRRFERMERVSMCTEIAADLNARHPYMSDEELGALVAELLGLLIKEKAAAQMAHFYGIDEDSVSLDSPNAATKGRVNKGLLARFLAFVKVGG